MAVEVVPGIQQLKVPLPMAFLPYVLVYVMKGADGYTLIDSGWATDDSWNALIEQLHELGIHINDVTHVIATHIHPDHYGLAGRIRDASGCEVVLHEKERWMGGGRTATLEEMAEQSRRWLHRQGAPAATIQEMVRASTPGPGWQAPPEPDTRLKGGERLKIGPYTLEAVWTPGHTAGHICLVEHDAGFMMTGDHVLPTITPNVSIYSEHQGDPLKDFLGSMDKLKPMGIKRGLAAHEHVIEDLPARLAALKEHHANRLNEMFTAITNGAETTYDIASDILWGPGSFHKFGGWQQRAAMSETLAHLVYARNRGLLKEEERLGVTVYTLAGER